jgi:hypothetical protein
VSATVKLASAGLLSLAATALLCGLLSTNTGLSFLAGSLVGVGSLVAVTIRVRMVFSRQAPQTRPWVLRLLGGLLWAGYYLVLVAAVYVLVRVAGASVLWLTVGYTVALIIFAIHMATSGRQRPVGPTAPER